MIVFFQRISCIELPGRQFHRKLDNPNPITTPNFLIALKNEKSCVLNLYGSATSTMSSKLWRTEISVQPRTCINVLLVLPYRNKRLNLLGIVLSIVHVCLIHTFICVSSMIMKTPVLTRKNEVWRFESLKTRCHFSWSVTSLDILPDRI